MSRLFKGFGKFNEDIHLWDVSNVTTMKEMFREATSFNQAIGGWTVRIHVEMEDMFWGASQFNQPLDGWELKPGWSVLMGKTPPQSGSPLIFVRKKLEKYNTRFNAYKKQHRRQPRDKSLVHPFDSDVVGVRVMKDIKALHENYAYTNLLTVRHITCFHVRLFWHRLNLKRRMWKKAFKNRHQRAPT